MIIKTINKNHRIAAYKNKYNGLYEICDEGRMIFGKGWDSIIIKDRLTHSQVMQLKKQINEL